MRDRQQGPGIPCSAHYHHTVALPISALTLRDKAWTQPSRGREVEHFNKSDGSQLYQITDGMGRNGVTWLYCTLTIVFYRIVIVHVVDQMGVQTGCWELPRTVNLRGRFLFSVPLLIRHARPTYVLPLYGIVAYPGSLTTWS